MEPYKPLVQCGPYVNNDNLLRWRIRQSQLWRHTSITSTKKEVYPNFQRRGELVSLLEAAWLRLNGYNVESVIAVREYSRGTITLSKMNSILDKNAGVSLNPVSMIPITNKAYPRKGDWVSFGEGKGASCNGYVCVVKDDYVGVMKQDGEFSPVDRELFTDHTSKGGRSTWYVPEE